ncbi:hypothetical protein ABZ721_18545 [Streptomyces sp. NPDC006733]|uniref:hypothetical protein n=1 Tax=Streptomyces sp. NPDC006733 TaxID=3155460 RepID=UPI0033D802E8
MTRRPSPHLSPRPSRVRARRAWLTATTVLTLALTGLAAPARAEQTPAPLSPSGQQDPQAAVSDAAPRVAGAAVSPGGKADPLDFTLQAGEMNGATADRVALLDGVLPTSGVSKLLAEANRTINTTSCTRDPFGTAPAPALKWCLDKDDSNSREWIPQAMTGVSDAAADERYGVGNDANIQLYASYDNWDPGRDSNGNDVGDCNPDELEANDACNQKGVRISFVQRRADGTVKYRHVLLGWAYLNNADHISFDGVHSDEGSTVPDPNRDMQNGLHAGGMVWYGHYLYVADTRNGIRIFDMEKIMDLDPNGDGKAGDAMGADTDGVKTTSDVEDKTKVGRQNNVWYSFGYRYVMPQVAAWKFKAKQSNPTGSFQCVGTGAPKASYLSLDRVPEPDRLIMGEYCRPAGDLASPGRIASFPVKELERRSGEVAAQGWANYLPMANGGAQGALALDTKLYVNQSAGHNDPGNLLRYRWSNGLLVADGSAIKTATGAEDLYYERGAQRLWSVSEHYGPAVNAESTESGGSALCLRLVCERVLYAHSKAQLDAP